MCRRTKKTIAMPIVDRPLKSLKGNNLLRPFLDVRYTNPHTGVSYQTSALIDTGADSCVLPAEMAGLLGHDLFSGEPTQFKGISGEVQTYYRHTMNINIDGYDFTTSDVMIAFSDTIKRPILGVKTFLCNFVLTVDYPGKTFSLKLPTEENNFSAWATP